MAGISSGAFEEDDSGCSTALSLITHARGFDFRWAHARSWRQITCAEQLLSDTRTSAARIEFVGILETLYSEIIERKHSPYIAEFRSGTVGVNTLCC